MKQRYLVLIFNFLFLTTLSFSQSEEDFLIGGSHIQGLALTKYFEILAETGMNTVEITHYSIQGAWNDSDLNIYKDRARVLEEIKLAKQNQFKVVLILRVHLPDDIPQNQFLWHGMIMPDSPEKQRLWFEKYHENVEYWARVCEEQNVEILVIGSELNALASTESISNVPSLYEYFGSEKRQANHERKLLNFSEKVPSRYLKEGSTQYNNIEEYIHDKITAQSEWAKIVAFTNQEDQIKKINERRSALYSEWIKLISTCRDHYSGTISFAANFDQYFELGFWDHLDLIGINAYFPILKFNNYCETLDCYERTSYLSWLKILDKVRQELKKDGVEDKPVLFTEIGYVNKNHSSAIPWKGKGLSLVSNLLSDNLIIWEKEEENYLERAGVIKGLRKAVRKKEFPLRGLLYWKFVIDNMDLKHEPYGLVLDVNGKDKLQDALLEFLND